MYLVKTNKKGVSLSLETIVIAILVLLALILVVFFIVKYGGQLGSSIKEQANISASLLPKNAP